MNKLKIELGTRTIGVDNALTECLQKKEFYPTIIISNENCTQNCRYVVTSEDVENLIKSFRDQVKYANDNGFSVK